MTTIYEVYIAFAEDDGTDNSMTRFFPRKADAMHYVRHGAEHEIVVPEDGVTVTAHEVVEGIPKREMYAMLLNGENWSNSQKVLYQREITFKKVEITDGD